MKVGTRLFGLLAVSAAALLWAVPFAWMPVATLRPGVPADIASLTPLGPFGPSNFAEAWHSGTFPLWYLNSFAVCGGILAVQLVTASAAGYAFARLDFPGRELLFALFLLQLLLIPPLLIVPNLATLVSLHLYDALPVIMAPYFASAFGVFLMRQTFRTISRDYEEAAMLEDTGSYDDTNLKTRAAIKAGRPPAAVIMSANFVREYVINDEVDPFDPLIELATFAPRPTITCDMAH
jgi:sn-glycerol 3-phosphate transport system permease protein